VTTNPSAIPSTTSSTSQGRRLRGHLGPVGIVFMVVAAAAPLTVIGGNMPLAMGLGNGAGAPVGFAIAALVLLVFSVGFVTMTPHVPEAGAFFSYVTVGLGQRMGKGIAVVALIAYTAIQIGIYGYIGWAISDTVAHYNGPVIPWPVYSFAVLAIVAVLGYRHIELSAKVLGVALTLVVFAGAELVTSSMMTLTQGTLMRATSPGSAFGALGFTFVANLLGSALFGTLVALAGVLHANPAAGAMLEAMLDAKAHESPIELFVRGILCNVLVCLAIWMVARSTTDGPKFVVIFWALLAFITSGFEHVVANMTTFTLGLATGVPSATWLSFGTNMLWVGLGNLVGGAVVVGIAYWVIGGSPRWPAARVLTPEEAQASV